MLVYVPMHTHTYVDAQKTSGRIHSKQLPGTLPSAGAPVLSKAAPAPLQVCEVTDLEAHSFYSWL